MTMPSLCLFQLALENEGANAEGGMCPAHIHFVNIRVRCLYRHVPRVGTYVCDIREGLLVLVSHCTGTSFKFQFQTSTCHLEKTQWRGCMSVFTQRSIVKLMYRLLWKPRCHKRACQQLLLPSAISCVCCCTNVFPRFHMEVRVVCVLG